MVNLGAIWQSINAVSTHERTIHKRKRPTAQKSHQTHLLQWCSLLLGGTSQTHEWHQLMKTWREDSEDTSTSVKTTYRGKRLERFPLDCLQPLVSRKALLFQSRPIWAMFFFVLGCKGGSSTFQVCTWISEFRHLLGSNFWWNKLVIIIIIVQYEYIYIYLHVRKENA